MAWVEAEDTADCVDEDEEDPAACEKKDAKEEELLFIDAETAAAYPGTFT